MTSRNDFGFNELVETVRRLRGEDGCPWDSKQTTNSLKKYLVEEFDEIITALDNKDYQNLCEELGDFLYLIVMLGEINEDDGLFDVSRIIGGINEKLIRRHPHVFGSRKKLSDQELRSQWARIKESEKADGKSS
jgi:uncharacterized protein YabN with tetrapyrrole methylase and pyrophosphatase domain